MATIENFFATRRAELDITQRKIADALGMTAQAVSAWECGRAIPEVTLFDRLAVIYRTTPERIAAEALLIARRRELQPA
jgi:transcriptional regulator with XRE-family HTH domain